MGLWSKGRAFDLNSAGIPQHPAGCIVIDTVLLENMPREQLLAVRVELKPQNLCVSESA